MARGGMLFFKKFQILEFFLHFYLLHSVFNVIECKKKNEKKNLLFEIFGKKASPRSPYKVQKDRWRS